jgi:hypothetical protein
MSAIIFQDGVSPLNAANLNSLNAVQAGTLAARPAANTVPAGRLYIATDAMGIFRSDGAVWLLVAQGLPLVTPAAFAGAPWSTPYDGMRVALLIDAANGIEWSFRYNVGSASAYKWEFIGGSPMRNSGDPNAVLNTLTQVGATGLWYQPSTMAVTAPRNGDYFIQGYTTLDLNGAASVAYTPLGFAGSTADGNGGPVTVTSAIWPSNAGTVYTVRTAVVAASAVGICISSGLPGTHKARQTFVAVTPIRIS